MTYYQGGKKRIGSEIAQVIYDVTTEYERKNGIKFKGYCEPFCGMLGVYQHIPGLFSRHSPSLKYIAGDRNDELILMWKASQRGWKPPTKCTKKEFERLKKSPKKSPKKSFLGHAASIRGVYFGTFLERNIKRQQEDVKYIGKIINNVDLTSGEYVKFSNLKKYIIYCDPPYENSVNKYKIGSKYKQTFDSQFFFQWCREMSKNNLVFISEYSMPNDFIKVWSKGKEKLFMICNI